MSLLGFAVDVEHQRRVVPVLLKPCGFVWRERRPGETGYCFHAYAEADGREVLRMCRREDEGTYWIRGRDEQARQALEAAVLLRVSAL